MQRAVVGAIWDCEKGRKSSKHRSGALQREKAATAIYWLLLAITKFGSSLQMWRSYRNLSALVLKQLQV
jgi:hypothetical protein